MESLVVALSALLVGLVAIAAVLSLVAERLA